MNPFCIISDSSCDLSDPLLEELDVRVIPFYVSFDQKIYRRERKELSLEVFYRRLTSEKIFPKSSMPSIGDYCDAFQAAIADGYREICCITITAKFSGSFNAASDAREIIMEDYPDVDIRIVDSYQATGGQGITVYEACRMRAAGYSFADTVRRLIELRDTSRIMFMVGTLEYLSRGGRVGKAAAVGANLLNLNPLIELYDAELQAYGTARGRKKAMKKVIEMVSDYFKKNKLSYDDYDFGVCKGHSSGADAEIVKANLEKLVGKKLTIPDFHVGVTIGTYTGPDPVGITFIRKYNRP